jgi:hypothetical protein
MNKKILLNFLWFLVGIVAIAAVPLLLLEQCSEVKKPKIREDHGQKHGSIDHSGKKQAICGNLIISRLAV